MTQQHPITPPPELIEQWMQNHATRYDLARHAAQWGADTELEACVQWMDSHPLPSVSYRAGDLRAERRPKSPSLKERALDSYDRLVNEAWCKEIDHDLEIVRRALEQLDG